MRIQVRPVPALIISPLFSDSRTTPVNEVSSLLERHGIRPTQQRVKVAEVLLTAPVHLTAEQLLTTLRQVPSRVSKATVYNTLKLFVDHGLVRQISPGSGALRLRLDHDAAPSLPERRDRRDARYPPRRADARANAHAAAGHRDRRGRGRDPGPSAAQLSPASTRGVESL